MNKTILSLFLFLYAIATAVAQDTISPAVSATRNFENDYRVYSSNPVTQPFIDSARYLNLALGYQNKRGDNRTAQEASRATGFSFRTDGSRRLKKYIVSGSFEYANRNSDSVAYTFRTDLSNTAPYYLYAARKGNWKSIDYALNGTVSRLLLNDKLVIGSNIDYVTTDSWRSNDPRPEYFSYKMNINTAVLYRLLKKHQVGLQAGLIKGSEDTRVGYQNEDYRNSNQAPEYVTWLQEGYGAQNSKSFILDLTGNSIGSKWMGLYQGSFTFGGLLVTTSRTKTNSRFYSRAVQSTVGVTEPVYGSYYEDFWDAAVLWRYTSAKNIWKVWANYKNHFGHDYNNVYGGNNYIYFYESLNISPLLEHRENNVPKYELGGSMDLNYLSRANGTNALRASYQYLNFSAYGGYFWYVSKKAFLKTSVGLGVYIPESAALTEVSQVTDFIENVVYRDYYYYNARATSASFDIKYTFPFKKTYPFVQFNMYYRNIDVKPGSVATMSLPGNNRLCWQFTIGMVQL
ncbi:hypothetical protein LQ567_04745 [Niabella pedocola]|uniref:DUF6850 domain-containing protein n=1 Tax=Niabella pedocola TaxID=1752077 RepID=A0ABS8PLT2_9BACT|nr:DUF6850 family outer membrane beta-barrel protein [Niabella pedocola]MCD2422058.1 hypothetical protein [Niabella pedocola]